jgi:RimJ/RimL family protein N-acetyltransferase
VPESREAFETERLVIRELREEDLEAVLPVYTSNPGYVALTEGSGGEPGRYDIDMLRRDFVVAQMTPGRTMAGIFLKEGGESVGVLDWMEENPADGKPWLGLLIIRADRQRHGFASEALDAFVERLRARGVRTVRAAVVERDEGARAFARRLGFEPISSAALRMTSTEKVIVLERRLG